jgi:hypothetical protein
LVPLFYIGKTLENSPIRKKMPKEIDMEKLKSMTSAAEKYEYLKDKVYTHQLSEYMNLDEGEVPFPKLCTCIGCVYERNR